MPEKPSRSEQKRRLRRLEEMVIELVKMSPGKLKKLRCEPDILELLRETQKLKAGAKKRQIKYISKRLRQESTQELSDSVAEIQGSSRNRTEAFHELEYLRDRLISEAASDFREADRQGFELDESLGLEAVAEIDSCFPDMDSELLIKLARLHARTGKRQYSREIFRLLRAALERQHISKAENR